MALKSPHSFRPTSAYMEPVLRVYLVRHGETNENRAGIIQGQLDTQLNDDGILQARFCGERLKGVKFVAAFTSDLHRAANVSTYIHTILSCFMSLILLFTYSYHDTVDC